MKAGKPSSWGILFEFDADFAYADQWSMMRQKLLESFQNALLVFYRSEDFKRIGTEIQVAQIWTGFPLQSKEDVAQLELRAWLQSH